jgi:hypothetical protein
MNHPRQSRAARALLLAAGALAACAGQGDGDDAAQTISGQVARNNFSSPVTGVRAVQGGDGAAWSSVGPDGRFALDVPLGRDYRLEVVAADGSHGFVTRSGGDVRPLQFSVCGAGAPFDLGHVRGWNESGDDAPPESCDETGKCCADDGTCCDAAGKCCFPDGTCCDPDGNCETPPCDPANDPGCCPDGNCEPPTPCDPATGENCCFPDGTCCDDSGKCCFPDGTCCDPDGNCETPPCDPATGENCCAPGDDCPPCVPGPDGSCDDPVPCEPQPDGSCKDPKPCDDGDPSCWPQPEPPPCDHKPGAGSEDACWSDGVVPDKPVPDFGCSPA